MNDTLPFLSPSPLLSSPPLLPSLPFSLWGVVSLPPLFRPLYQRSNRSLPLSLSLPSVVPPFLSLCFSPSLPPSPSLSLSLSLSLSPLPSSSPPFLSLLFAPPPPPPPSLSLSLSLSLSHPPSPPLSYPNSPASNS